MIDQFTRTRMLLGKENISKLQHCHVAVFGVGGVGGYVVEALARSGVGHLSIIDHDDVALTNINRQVIALNSTIDKKKVDVFKERLLDINPNIIVDTYPLFYLPETKDQIPLKEFDYIVDAIDTVTAKIELIVEANDKNIPILSSMGCGNRLDPTKLKVSDIYKTKNDPLAKVMRHELRKRKIKKCKVVYSTELPLKPIFLEDEQEESTKRQIPGSNAIVPPSAGLLIASEVIKDLLEK